MSNYCTNKVIIVGNVSQFKRCIVQKDADLELEFDFNTIIPCPAPLHLVTHSLKELNEMDKKWRDEKYEGMVQLAKDNIAKYGHSYWFDWCRENWGVKWSPSDLNILRDDPRELILVFNTANKPANDFFIGTMSEQFPDLEFKWYYYEPNMGFAGIIEAKDGDVENSQYLRDDKEYAEIEDMVECES